jgi:hypothetical protein
MYRKLWVEDKKFCSDGCRNAYNNKINKDSNNYMRTTTSCAQNYRILSELNLEGKSKQPEPNY